MLFESMFADQIIVSMHLHSDPLLGTLSFILLAIITLWLYYNRHQQRQLRLQNFLENDMGITLKVDGMSCQHCVANVKKSLEALAGVDDVTPDLESGNVMINGDKLDDALLRQAITDAGYVVKD